MLETMNNIFPNYKSYMNINDHSKEVTIPRLIVFTLKESRDLLYNHKPSTNGLEMQTAYHRPGVLSSTLRKNWPWYSLRGLHICIIWFSLYGIRIPLFPLYGICIPLFSLYGNSAQTFEHLLWMLHCPKGRNCDVTMIRPLLFHGMRADLSGSPSGAIVDRQSINDFWISN